MLELSKIERIGYTLAFATTKQIPIHLIENVKVSEEEFTIILDETSNRLILGVLRNLTAHNPMLREYVSTHFIRNYELLKRPEVKETLDNFISGKVHVLGVIEFNDNNEIVFTDCKVPPLPGSYVYVLRSPELLQRTFKLDKSIMIGKHVYSGWEIPLIPDYVNHHVGIFGTTGTGKSRLAVVLAKELVKQGWHVIIFDHTGIDYVPFFKGEGKVVESCKIKISPEVFANTIRRLSRLGSYYDEYIELAVFDYLNIISTDELIEKSREVMEEISTSTTRSRQGRLRYNGASREEKNSEEVSLIPETAKVIDRDIEEARESFIKSLIKIMKITGARDTSIARAIAYIRTFIPPGIFLEFNRRAIRPEQIVEDVLSNGIVVIDLSCDRELSIKQAIISSIIETSWSRVKMEGKPLNIVFIIDEARNYVPAREEPPSKEAIVTTVREGRKWNLAVILVSQRYVGDIDPDVRSNLNTIIFSNLPSTADLNEMSRYINLAGIDESSIVKLRQKQFYITGLINPLKTPIMIQVKEVHT